MSSRGSLVLSSPLFSHVINAPVSHLVCDHCLARPSLMDDDPNSSSARLDRCSGCRVVHYCTKPCQRQAWRKHKHECKYLKNVAPRVPPSIVRLLERTVKQIHEKPDYHELLPDKRKRRFSDLMSHKDEIVGDREKMEAFHSFTEVLYSCVGRELYTTQELLEVYCRILINSVEITDDFGNSVGTGVYLALSAVDHSCKPNVSVTFHGNTARLRAIENIKEPLLQNIRLNYLTQIVPRDERRRRLKQQYYFDCNCDLCLDKDADNVIESFVCPKCFQAVPVDALKCKSCLDIVTKEELNKRRAKYYEVTNGLDSSDVDSRRALENYQRMVGVVHPMDWRMIDASEQAMSAALEENKLLKFVEIGSSLVEPYLKYYPEYSPSLGLHLMKVGKAALYVEDEDKAVEMLWKALKIITVSHGDNHNLYGYLSRFPTLASNYHNITC